MRVLLLAAGYATRLYPLTRDCPKALLPAGQGVLLDYILDRLLDLPGLGPLTLVSNHRFARAFEHYAESLETRGFPIPLEVLDDGSTDEASKRGALGDLAFYLAQHGTTEPLLVMASDNLFTYDLRAPLGDFERLGVDCLLGQPMEDKETLRQMAVARCTPEGRILSLVEKPQHPEGPFAVYATYFYTPESLRLLSTYLAEGGNPDAPGHFPAWLLGRRPLHLHRFKGEAYDIGTPQAYAEAKRMLTAFSIPAWCEPLPQSEAPVVR